MNVSSFQQLPDHAKVWVYQANRPFTENEVDVLTQNLSGFVNQWKAHGQELAANFTIAHNQFIILAVDESLHGASGCSIDASVGLIRALEQQLTLTLLDRSQVAALIDDSIFIFPFNQAKKQIESGTIHPETIIFNNSIHNLGQFRGEWAIPAKQSWLGRFFD